MALFLVKCNNVLLISIECVRTHNRTRSPNQVTMEITGMRTMRHFSYSEKAYSAASFSRMLRIKNYSWCAFECASIMNICYTLLSFNFSDHAYFSFNDLFICVFLIDYPLLHSNRFFLSCSRSISLFLCSSLFIQFIKWCN